MWASLHACCMQIVKKIQRPDFLQINKTDFKGLFIQPPAPKPGKRPWEQGCSFSWRIFGQVLCLDQLRASENIWCIISLDIGFKADLFLWAKPLIAQTTLTHEETINTAQDFFSLSIFRNNKRQLCSSFMLFWRIRKLLNEKKKAKIFQLAVSKEKKNKFPIILCEFRIWRNLTPWWLIKERIIPIFSIV